MIKTRLLVTVAASALVLAAPAFAAGDDMDSNVNGKASMNDTAKDSTTTHKHTHKHVKPHGGSNAMTDKSHMSKKEAHKEMNNDATGTGAQ